MNQCPFSLSAALLFLASLIPAGAVVEAREASPSEGAASPRRPSILLLMTDQHHHAALGCAGSPLARTPRLDRLAREGARFTRATCATPFCSPTRASILTGRWPHAHRIVQNVPGRAAGIEREGDLLPDLLARAGYRCRWLGKWHLGDVRRVAAYARQPSEREERAAYERWRRALPRGGRSEGGARAGEVLSDGVYMTPAIARAHARWKSEPRRSRQDLSRIGRSPLEPRAEYESWLADRAVEWLREQPGRPFFLALSFSPPHAFWVAPDPYYSSIDPAAIELPASFGDRPAAYRASQPARMGALLGEEGVREYRRCYLAQVAFMDALFGRVLEALEELGLERDTLVIFTSDHGDMQGAHHMMGKSVPAFYEEIVRVPLIARFPGRIAAGRELASPAGSVDLLPTILDFAGIAVPERVQGRSLRPELEGKAAAASAGASFCERGLEGRRSSRMIRTAEWKYALFGDGRRELFHLAEDPAELRNLADLPEHHATLERLEKELNAWRRRTEDPALEEERRR